MISTVFTIATNFIQHSQCLIQNVRVLGKLYVIHQVQEPKEDIERFSQSNKKLIACCSISLPPHKKIGPSEKIVNLIRNFTGIHEGNLEIITTGTNNFNFINFLIINSQCFYEMLCSLLKHEITY